MLGGNLGSLLYGEVSVMETEAIKIINSRKSSSPTINLLKLTFKKLTTEKAKQNTT